MKVTSQIRFNKQASTYKVVHLLLDGPKRYDAEVLLPLPLGMVYAELRVVV